MEYQQLKLDNQLCFPVYAASRLIIREYQPYLDRLGITYPQYLVLLVLWETDGISVNTIAERLILHTNTVTPLLKRMESQGILKRQRSGKDERKVMVELTETGRSMKSEAAGIPAKLASALISDSVNCEGLGDLKDKLLLVVRFLTEKGKSG
jgi:DNA-binding MarR family transcriptional regulator